MKLQWMPAPFVFEAEVRPLKRIPRQALLLSLEAGHVSDSMYQVNHTTNPSNPLRL